LKIIDFGLSEYVREKREKIEISGTPGFVAPEILNNHPYDEKCDLFSAGVVLFYMLTGSILFAGSNPEATLIMNKDCNL